MAGGQELAELQHELRGVDPSHVVDPAHPEAELAGPGKPHVVREEG
jgi:simple sugar transport system ATP-binding protein